MVNSQAMAKMYEASCQTFNMVRTDDHTQNSVLLLLKKMACFHLLRLYLPIPRTLSNFLYSHAAPVSHPTSATSPPRALR
jgi:hypothetical protein